MTATKTKSLTNRADGVSVSMPIYVGVDSTTAKRILNLLRDKIGSRPDDYPGMAGNGTIRVTDNTTMSSQLDLEKRLKIDLHILRDLLFGSDRTGVRLDLMLRIQRELEDEFTFLCQEDLKSGFEQSLSHYKGFAEDYELTPTR